MEGSVGGGSVKVFSQFLPRVPADCRLVRAGPVAVSSALSPGPLLRDMC